jgi:hypothetical protein
VNRRVRATLDILLRWVLALGIVFSPLSQPLAMASLAAPQQTAAGGCPHHAKAAGHAGVADKAQPGGCCCKQGAACHCAMAVALPTMPLAFASGFLSDHPVSVPRLTLSRLPSPEPPPPRG